MTAYIRWVAHQLYLLFFWPSAFERTTEHFGLRERLQYVLTMAPSIVAFLVGMNAATGLILMALGEPYDWLFSFFGIAIVMVVAILVGVTIDSAYGVAFSIGFGVATSVTFGTEQGLVRGAMGGIIGGAAMGFTLGGVSKITLGTLPSVAVGVAIAVMGGVTFGALAGVADGVAFVVTAPVVFWVLHFRLLTYPLEAVLALISFSMAAHDAKRAWRWCPARWDEAIWLPLPGLTSLLVRLAREDRDAGISAITFLAAERALQRRAARAALLQVALDDLRADSVGKIAQKAQSLNWWTRESSFDIEDKLKGALARFGRIAERAGQYAVVQNSFRRGETLDAALKELEELQRSLSLDVLPESARLLGAANAWREVLAAERAVVRGNIAASRDIPNPFVFGNPVGEGHADVFTGRGDLVRLVEASLLGAEHPPTLLLYGARRMGKSSIVKQLPRLLGPDFASADLDCQNPAVRESSVTLLRYLGRTVSESLRRRGVAIEAPTAEELAHESYATFDEWLDRVEKALPPGMRVLICLDEYERLQDAIEAGWGPKLLDALRHTIQHRAHLALMFVGAHTFAELGPQWTDRFISARRLRVSFLTPDEVRPLLINPIPAFDLAYAPEALEAVIAATHGQPFLTQAVAFELVQHMNEQGRKEATVADVEAAIYRALKSGGEYFADVWSEAGREGQAILLAVVGGETPPDLPGARLWLIDHDVLDAGGRFLVPMMERWVREHPSAGESFGSRR